jgi:hypothetical protein
MCTTGSNPVASFRKWLFWLIITIVITRIMCDNITKCNTMNFNFFAIRPMFSATERVALSRNAFVSKIRVAHLSKRKSALRGLTIYNIFSLKNTGPLDYSSIERFSRLYGFFLVASLTDGYILSTCTTKSFISFYTMGFAPILLRSCTFVFCSLFLKIFLMSLFSKKWLQ